MSSWMVECFWPGVSQAAVTDATSRLDAATAAVRRAGAEARRTVVTYVPAEETVLWLFEAEGEETLHEVARLAQVRFDRVLPVVTASTIT